MTSAPIYVVLKRFLFFNMTSSRGTFSDKRQDLYRLLMLFYSQCWKSLCPPLKLTINISTTETNVAAVTPLLQRRGRFIWGGHANDRKFHLRGKKSQTSEFFCFSRSYFTTIGILILESLWGQLYYFWEYGRKMLCRNVKYSENIEDSRGNYWKKKKWIISHLLWQM